MQENDMHSEGGKPIVEVDLSRYLPIFEDEEISDEDKLKLLEALWSIVLTFAKLGWGLHPAQQAQEARQIACGKSGQSSDATALVDASVIDLESISAVPEFGSAARTSPQEASDL